MTERCSRRRWLSLAGVAGLGFLAGCSEGGSDDDGGDSSEDDGSGDGTGGNGDDGGDSDDSDGGNDDTDDGGDDSDGGDDDGGDDTDDGNDDTDDGGDDTDDGGDDGDGGDDDTDDGTSDDPRLRDVITLETSYTMEFEFSEGSGTWTFHEGDSYMQWESDGEEVETYRINTESGVETYTVTGGQCFRREVEMPEDDIFDPEAPEEDDEEYVASGTTTIDGEEVYVFDIGDGTYYVSVATGYPVRFESENGDVVTFHSWGQTDPISPPDMECRDA